MKYGTTLLENLLRIFESTENVYCRLAIFKNLELEPEWRAFRFFLDIGSEEQPQKDVNYNYGKVAFACGNVAGRKVKHWLQADQAAYFCGYHFKIGDLRDQADWSRSSSHRRNVGFNRIPDYYSTYPFTSYRLQFKEDHFAKLKDVIDPEEALINPGCPSFTDYYTGLAHLIHHVGRRIGEDPHAPEIIIRVVHKDAWIDKVFLGSNRVAVTVQGDQIQGTRLAVGGGGKHDERELEYPITNLFSLSHNDTDRIWVILSKDEEWLDQRDLDIRYGPDRFLWENIEATPDNIYDQVKDWMRAGESYTMEYKRQITQDENTLLKTLVAFANGQGGIILLGVDDDQSLHGVEHEFPQSSLDKYKNKITDLIHAHLSPFPNYQISHCVINGHTIVAIQVFEGADPPYISRKNGSPVVYVRRNATTYAATPAEIREISLKAMPAQTGINLGRF